jgi:hypothetical protein
LFRIFAIDVIPLSFQVSSVIPERANICAMFTRFVPVSRVASRLGSQSTPICAWPLATTTSGVMLGPPSLKFTSSPNAL